MFSVEDARPERLRRIPLLNRNGSLQDDGASIELSGDEMNRSTADLDAVRNRLSLRIHSRK